ncbi:hypothetical protein BOX15_Mlig025833g1 [Macrostomum lignano]|uniref:Ubiquitin-like domain-containing protein n=1 Tax=Macrostomum lignano TaxID=282301 RepID=A0A267FS37_9PLAT|nr:hypothetical protein BOX15_Mlig025833g1 [Macrostomum lignano]
MKLTILYLSKKTAIECTEDSYELLATKVAQEIGVPIAYQKLIYKGKSLHPGSLTEQGLKNNEKVMLIGSKAMDQSEADALSSIESIEKSIADLEIRLEIIREEFSDYSQGFVPTDLRHVFLRALTKRAASITSDAESCRSSLVALLGRSTSDFANRIRERRRNSLKLLDSLQAKAESLLADLLDDDEQATNSEAEDCTLD